MLQADQIVSLTINFNVCTLKYIIMNRMWRNEHSVEKENVHHAKESENLSISCFIVHDYFILVNWLHHFISRDWQLLTIALTLIITEFSYNVTKSVFRLLSESVMTLSWEFFLLTDYNRHLRNISDLLSWCIDHTQLLHHIEIHSYLHSKLSLKSFSIIRMSIKSRWKIVVTKTALITVKKTLWISVKVWFCIQSEFSYQHASFLHDLLTLQK